MSVLIKYCLCLAAILALMPYSVNEITEFDNTPFLDNVTHELKTIHVPFIENIGQIQDDNIKYYAHTFAGSIFVSDDDITYLSNTENNTRWITKEVFLNGNVSPKEFEKSQTVVNYFKGNSDNWKSGIPTYDSINLGNVWPSIQVDLKAYGNNIEKIFTIFPGGDVSKIKTTFTGVSKLDVNTRGELVIYTEKGEAKFSKPIAYQIIDDQKFPISVSYDVNDLTYGFSVGNYDSKLPLVIDPLIASTFVGGSDLEEALYDIVLDSSGNVYITGETSSTDYPTVSGYDSSHNGNYDAFVSKLNSDLSSLSASTFIGGSMDDASNSIALDSSGNVYITGETSSTDYPTVSGYDSSHNGSDDAFVSKFDSTLSSLLASTLIGGNSSDIAWDITLDNSTNVYITGDTYSTDYPTVSGYDSSHNGSDDAFVSKLNSDLSSLSASTFIGGSANEPSFGITLDSSGNVYITGFTNSTDYPTVSGYDSSHNGNYDAFVSKLNSTLSSLSASTFVGGSDFDESVAIALDSFDNVYIIGETYSTDYPTVSGYDSSHSGDSDAFVSKLNSDLSSLSASTFIGGSSIEISEAITLDSSGNVYITGETNSTDYPTVSGYDSSHNGSDDAFVSKLNSNLSSLSASTFIGGNDDEQSFAIILDNARNVYITGFTNSTDYPTVSGYDSSHNGGSDVFVSYLDCDLSDTGSECTSPLVFLDSEVVASGGEFTVTLPENDAGSVNTVEIDLPPGVEATIIVSTTDEGTETDPDILFLDQVLDFDITSSTPSFTFQVRFTFTDEDLEAAGLSLDEVAIFRDENENGSFDENESLVTTITPSSAPGPYTAEADVPSNSKFAIGGVANAVAGIGAAGNFLGLIQDTCDESGFGQGESLRIYEISYDKCDANQITILADTTCGPMKIFVEEESSMNLAGMSSDQPYLNEQKRMIVLSSPITSDITEFSVIAKDKRDEFYQKINADQCSATKEYTFTTGYTSEQNSATSLLLPDWIKNNAKWWSNNEIDDDTFVNGVQYLVEHDIISVQKDIQTENTNDTIPDWIKNNAKWWSNDEIDDQTFVNGIQHLVKVGIIKVN